MSEDGLSPVTFRPIGVVRTPHRRPEETPIQPRYARGIPGEVRLLPEFEEGLRDIEGFSHVCLIYHLHRARPGRLLVKPFLQDVERGVFATCAPSRPNPVGTSVVRLVRREGRTLHVENVDILDGTPLLDIKPYVPRFDDGSEVRSGWQAEVDEETARRRGRRGYRG